MGWFPATLLLQNHTCGSGRLEEMELPGDRMTSEETCPQDGVSPWHCQRVCDGIVSALAMCPPGRYVPAALQ